MIKKNRMTQNNYNPGGGGGSGPSGSKVADGGIVTLNAADTSKAITFSVAYSSSPSVVGNIVMPDGSAFNIECNPDYSTLTPTGVTFRFAGIPDSGYRLAWQAAGSV